MYLEDYGLTFGFAGKRGRTLQELISKFNAITWSTNYLLCFWNGRYVSYNSMILRVNHGKGWWELQTKDINNFSSEPVREIFKLYSFKRFGPQYYRATGKIK